MGSSPILPIITLTMNPALDVSTSAEKVKPQHKLRCDPPQVAAGGGGVNVARAVIALGGAAIPVYNVGGLTGERYRLLLHDEGIPGIPLVIRGETRESITVDDRAGGGQYRFVFPGAIVSPEESRRITDTAVGLLQPGSYLVVSGSLPPGTPDGFYAEVVARAHERGAYCAIDASGPALAQAISAGPDLVKPSLRELRELIGRELETPQEQDAAMLEVLAGSRAGAMALTLGSEGAARATRDGVLRAPAFPVTERGTVGSGDAFLAAFVLRTVQGRTAADALTAALAAGAAVASSHGSTAPHRELVEHLEQERAPRSPDPA